MSITPNNSCYCPQITPGTESSIISGTPVTNGPNANLLADTLGVSPLYRQQEWVWIWSQTLHNTFLYLSQIYLCYKFCSFFILLLFFSSARWQSAAHIYQSSRSHSPVPQATPQFPFSIDERENMCLTPQKLSQQLLMQAGLNNIG